MRRLARVPLVLLALAFVWYGAMACLLATKTSPHTVNEISGYRTAYRVLTTVDASDITWVTRLTTGLVGITGFLVFGFLAWKTIARPRRARSDYLLAEDERGATVVAPRAIERAGEGAALGHAAVSSAAARYAGDELVLAVELVRARDAVETLLDVRRRARDALSRHGLPVLPVEVRLTGYERDTGRELA